MRNATKAVEKAEPQPADPMSKPKATDGSRRWKSDGDPIETQGSQQQPEQGTDTACGGGS